MAQLLNSSSQDASSPAAIHSVLITNKHGEKLVGLLHPTGSNKIVVLCHGFTASKRDSIIVDLADAITKQGISIFRFDFSGNGESEGEFQYGNYRKEADDLHSVVSHLYQAKYDVTAIVGHSKGGDVVVLYASLYDDVHMVVNLSGRFYLEKGIEERLGKEFIDRINKEGYIDVTDKSGKILYRVTKDSLMERLNTDMHATSLSISKECRSETNIGIITLISELPTETSGIPWNQHAAFSFTKVVVHNFTYIRRIENNKYFLHFGEGFILCYKPPVANFHLILASLFSLFTVHGSADEVIPVEDAYEFAKHITTHKLSVIDGADHCYTAHRKELSDAVVDFIMSNKAGDTSLAKDE